MTTPAERRGVAPMALRAFSWTMIWLVFAFLVENYLSFWQGWPGAGRAFSGEAPLLALFQAGLYAAAVAAGFALAHRHAARPLRADSDAITGLAAFIARAAFFAVLLVGIVDFTLSFLRVENLLGTVFGESLAAQLGLSRFRGPYVHLPLIGIAVVLAAFTRILGFPWLTLLVVAAELLLVVGRFVFGYEQAFMADLVRMWYAGLFLFASAYTLVEDGHVRIDVFYASRSTRTRALVNGIGSVVLGMTLCWTILAFGMSSGSSAINAPIISFEQGQQGFGMFTKYLMAAFLAVFAVTMLIQFSGTVLQSAADFFGEPGRHDDTQKGAM